MALLLLYSWLWTVVISEARFEMSPSQSESPDSAKQRRIDRLCSEIAEYFRNHPHASDTVEGITVWWLTEREEEDIDVEEALNRLVAQGCVVRRVLCDGTFLYQVTRVGETPEVRGFLV